MPERKDRRFDVSTDEELYQQAKAYAEENGISLSAFIRGLIRWWFRTGGADRIPTREMIEEKHRSPGAGRPRKGE